MYPKILDLQARSSVRTPDMWHSYYGSLQQIKFSSSFFYFISPFVWRKFLFIFILNLKENVFLNLLYYLTQTFEKRRDLKTYWLGKWFFLIYLSFFFDKQSWNKTYLTVTVILGGKKGIVIIITKTISKIDVLTSSNKYKIYWLKKQLTQTEILLNCIK